MAKQDPKFHLDLIGREVRVGDYVAAYLKVSYSNTLQIAKVVKLTPKKVNLVGLKNKKEWSAWAGDVAKLDSEDVVAFILKYE